MGLCTDVCLNVLRAAAIQNVTEEMSSGFTRFRMCSRIRPQVSLSHYTVENIKKHDQLCGMTGTT